MTDDITLPGVLSLVGWAGVLMVRLLAHSWLSGLSPRVLGRSGSLKCAYCALFRRPWEPDTYLPGDV